MLELTTSETFVLASSVQCAFDKLFADVIC